MDFFVIGVEEITTLVLLCRKLLFFLCIYKFVAALCKRNSMKLLTEISYSEL